MIAVAVTAVGLAVVACALDDAATSRRLAAHYSAIADEHHALSRRYEEHAESLWRSAQRCEADLAKLETTPGRPVPTAEVRRREAEIDGLRARAELNDRQAKHHARIAQRYEAAAREPLHGAAVELPEPR
jgi:hypothetical protein